MAKKKVGKPQREVTKRQLSRWQRQKKRQRIILGFGIFIIVAVIAIVGGGWYFSDYQPLRQTVIKVNGTEFNMNYYVKMLEFYGKDVPAGYMGSVADEVVRIIEQNELIRQEAMALGIAVSDKEVDKELKNYDPPLSKDYRDVARAGLLVDKLLEDYFDQKVPVSAEQRHIMAMLLESEGQASGVRTRIESGEDFGNSAGELSLEGLSRTQNGDLGWHPRDVLAELLSTSVPGDYAFSLDVGALSQPVYDETITKGVGYWLVEVLEKKEDSEEVHVQAMLLGSEEEAQAVRARLEAGEDFAALVKELTQLDYAREEDGDLGWLTEGMVSSAFDEFAFNAEVETLSEPIRDEAVVTKGGYWLLRVLDKDGNREISDDDRDLLKSKTLEEWVSALWDNTENDIDDSYLDDEKKTWAIEKMGGS